MKFVLLGEYCTLNEYSDAERTHYRYGASIKKAETQRAMQELMIQQWDGEVPVPKSVFKFTWYRKNRRTDPDNIAFAKKFIIDAMQKVGIINNDGWNQIAGFIDYFEVDKDNPRVEIELLDIEEGCPWCGYYGA